MDVKNPGVNARVKSSAGRFPGCHDAAQASIEHSSIAQPKHGFFTTEKQTLVKLAFLSTLMARRIYSIPAPGRD